MTKLSNVKGRITYISSHAKQENLYAVYETTERKFWRELAKCNQEEFAKSGTEGKCIEARELIIALPESFTEYPLRPLDRKGNFLSGTLYGKPAAAPYLYRCGRPAH